MSNNSKNKYIVLGIDPGIADTGYGVIEFEEMKMSCLDYGSIKTGPKERMPDRLEKLSSELNKIIKKYRPAIFAIEQLFFCNNVKTAIAVGQARGVALLAAGRNKIPVVEFTPIQVKQAVSSYGGANKQQVQKMVKLILNLKEIPRPDDAADALAIAIAAGNSKKFN